MDVDYFVNSYNQFIRPDSKIIKIIARSKGGCK